MEKLIACCGLNCVACNTRIATVKNDNELRAKTAEQWKVLYNVPEMTAGMINCTGCMAHGAKLAHCEICEIRNCAISKGFLTCADCVKMEHCGIIMKIHQYAPEALENLKSLNYAFLRK